MGRRCHEHLTSGTKFVQCSNYDPIADILHGQSELWFRRNTASGLLDASDVASVTLRAVVKKW